MKPENLTPDVLAKLGFAHPIDYDVKTDGQLVVIDRCGSKYKLPMEDYVNLLGDAPLTVKPVIRRGRKPKVVG